MNWLNRAEARFGFLAIPGLPAMIVGLNALVFVLYKLNPGYLAWLVLDPALVWQGQVWRVVTFLFVPSWQWILPVPDWFGVVLYLSYIYFIGTAVERAMGAFQLTLYYLLGMVGMTVAGLIFGGEYGNGLLNTTLLFAFVRYYPDAIFLLFFVLPVRAVWIAWLAGASLVWKFVFAPWSFRVSLLLALANYLLFFGPEIVRAARQRHQQVGRRQRFEKDREEATAATLHECAVCHRTETTAELEFRVARDGQEYCLEHLPKSPKV